MGAFIGFLLIGLLAGWLAGKIMKASTPYGLWGDLAVGVIGALLGGFVFSLLGLAAFGLIGRLVTATAGAVLLLWILRKLGSK